MPSLRSIADRVERDWWLILCGAGIGTLTGLGAYAFAEVLHVFEHFTNGVFLEYPVWPLFVVPLVGMALTGVLVQLFATEAKGHGVPQVMDALIRKRGVIPLRIGIVKVVASILTVGSGGSAGTEGPIVQIGATAGSWIGQKFRVSREDMGTFVGCGAAAGIASIFNAPIAGVFFVLEILLRDFSLKTFTPIVVASVFSTAITQAVHGENEAIFAVNDLLGEYNFTILELPSYAALGVVCGLIAIFFNRTLHLGEDLYEKVPLHPMLKPVTGAILLGALGVLFLVIIGEHSPEVPSFFGNGYDTIKFLLNPVHFQGAGNELAHALPTTTLVLAMVVLFKTVATTCTLASGGSGGVFAPSLFLGAAGGAAFGLVLNSLHLLPEGSSPAAYALVGMAAVVAASTHAPLTAILILFELTRDVYVLLPIMLAAVLAVVVAQFIDRDSIYTAKLRRQGVSVGTARDLTVLRRIHADMVEPVNLPPEPIYASDPLSKLITMHATHHVPDFVVTDTDGRYVGMVTGADIRTALIDREAIPLLLVAELVRTDLPSVHPDDTLDTVLDKFATFDIACLCMVDRYDTSRPASIITRARVMRRYQRELDKD